MLIVDDAGMTREEEPDLVVLAGIASKPRKLRPHALTRGFFVGEHDRVLRLEAPTGGVHHDTMHRHCIADRGPQVCGD